MPGYHQVEVPAENRVILAVAKKDEFGNVPCEDRYALTLRGKGRELAAEILRPLTAALEFNHSLDQVWDVPLCGVLLGRQAAPFWSVVVMDAPRPVSVRRNSWPVERILEYTHKDGILIFTNGYWPTLSPVDLAADDWRVVDNPNIVEEEIEQDTTDTPDGGDAGESDG